MQCNFCETENPETAVFCKKCGKRMDGMALCSACGKLTPADGEFCVNCGSNRNAPVYSMPVRFPRIAEQPGPKPRAAKAETPGGCAVKASVASVASDAHAGAYAVAARAEKREIFSGRTKEIMERISFICSLGAALIGMIFVFLIGCVPHVSVGSAGGGLVTNEVGIFYFFGDAYDAIVSDGSTASMAGTIGAVLGTVCSLVALLATAGCFIATVSRLVKISQKQTEKGIMGPAAATFFAYVCGAALFLLCMANKVDIMGVTTSMAANGTTIAGFVLGGLLLVAAAVLKTLANGLGGNLYAYIRNVACGALYAVLSIVALRFICSCVASVGADSVDNVTTYGISSFFSNLSVFAASVASPAAEDRFMGFFAGGTAAAIVLTVAVIAFCIFLISSVSAFFTSVGEELDKRMSRNMVLAGICAIVAGAMMILASVLYADWAGNVSAHMTTPVIAIVVGVLMIADAVVYKMLLKKDAYKQDDIF